MAHLKKKKNQSLGRSVIKDRFGKAGKKDSESFLHTSELNDGYEWSRLNLHSVTEQSNLEDFLSTAELAGTEFTAEKLNMQFVTPASQCGLLHGEELSRMKDLHKQHASQLKIPRRPPWTKELSSTVLDQNERESFLEWRRSLASLQETDGIVMTPYEKNLDFWRQLWRVIERSDLIVQIVDARNPLLFYCPDLNTYVKEVDEKKVSLVLINKADFLDETQREMWADYFSRVGVRVVFWSALIETQRQQSETDLEEEAVVQEEPVSEDEAVDMADNCTETDIRASLLNSAEAETESSFQAEEPNVCVQSDVLDFHMPRSTINKLTTIDSGQKARAEDTQVFALAGQIAPQYDTTNKCSRSEYLAESVSFEDNTKHQEYGSFIKNSGDIYSGSELVELFKSLHQDFTRKGLTIVGMVGYPNVGKSSTINAILKMKKVPVSAVPGRTKHFQTLYVDPTLMLCDCPGLVFPSFVNTKADLVVNGVLPIDQMRDFIPPVALVSQLIPRNVLCKTYGILLPQPSEGEDPSRFPTAHELLNAYGAMRGFMTSRGVPDCPRSARYILKDYVNGKLLYCHPPPGEDAIVFNRMLQKNLETLNSPALQQAAVVTTSKQRNDVAMSKIDQDFFSRVETQIHSRSAGPTTKGSNQSSIAGKPWKRHNNRNKKEKLRKVYGHLDN